MISFKRLLVFGLSFLCLLAGADDKTAIQNCVEKAIKAGMTLDFNIVKGLCTGDYVKIQENQKVLDRKLLDNTAIYFERMKDPDLKFSELVELKFMIRGQKITEDKLAHYRKLDSTGRGKALVQQAQAEIRKTHENLCRTAGELLKTVQYGPMFLHDDLAVWFYKLDWQVKFKGVIVLRKENNFWKISREFSTLDNAAGGDQAIADEVRNFMKENERKSRNFSSYTELLAEYSPENVSVMSDGKSMNYAQAEKLAKFHDSLLYSTPTMVQAAPLYIEAYGGKVTPEMLAHFADQDKSGQGKQWLSKYQEAMKKHREELRNAPDDYTIKHIFLYEDMALIMDSWSLPAAGKIERVSLIKKHQGKYLLYRTVSRKAFR